MAAPGTKMKNIAAALLVPLNSLLLFFLLFYSRLSVPPWLQVAGRMHPLMLHFPIVLLILFILLAFLGGDSLRKYQGVALAADLLLMLSALSAVITALMGLFLSKEPGYDTEAIQWHKWGGIALAFSLSAMYWFRQELFRQKMRLWSSSVLCFLLMVFASHQGAGITHGQNFLLAPILPEKQRPQVSPEEAIVYTHLVQPILEDKCLSCHNHRKAKGELVMETKELLLKGGKDGVLWDTLAPDLGLLMHRIHLPLEQKKHMPPQGKPQLSDEEMQILYHWIKLGSSFDLMLRDLAPTDTLRQLAVTFLNEAEAETYDFAGADENEIRKLNNANRVVYPIALESPALNIDFYNRQNFSSESLHELMPVSGQVVAINLAHMPLKDDDLKTIASFKNLRRLNLNFTDITGSTLGLLKGLPNLQELSIAGTAIKKDKLHTLQEFPQLKRAYIWNTSLTLAELEDFGKQKGRIKYETGFRSDTLLMKLTPPILQNEERLLLGPLPLKLKHYIPGAIIRYTLDGTEPDSTNSPIYDGKQVLNSNVMLKARAFKAGWIGSDALQQFFFRTTFVPDSASLLLPPDPKYKGQGSITLIDKEKGDFNFGDGRWLGYRNNPAEIMLFYNKPVQAHNVTLSILKMIGSFILPPASFEIWGDSKDMKHLKLLGRVAPLQPQKDESADIVPVEINFPEQSLKYIKIIIRPLAKLPAWHTGKGEKAWVFLDEVMVN